MPARGLLEAGVADTLAALLAPSLARCAQHLVAEDGDTRRSLSVQQPGFAHSFRQTLGLGRRGGIEFP